GRGAGGRDGGQQPAGPGVPLPGVADAAAQPGPPDPGRHPAHGGAPAVSAPSRAERSAILRGARDACATAADLRLVVAELRSESGVLRSDATALRRESARLRGRVRTAGGKGTGGGSA